MRACVHMVLQLVTVTCTYVVYGLCELLYVVAYAFYDVCLTLQHVLRTVTDAHHQALVYPKGATEQQSITQIQLNALVRN